MASLSDIRNALTSYVTSVVWVQQWGVEDPNRANPVVSSTTYPVNVAAELPLQSFKLSREQVADGSDNGFLQCEMRIGLQFLYVFTRDIFRTFRDIPVKQLEDLYGRLCQILILFGEKIHQDVRGISIPEQLQPFTVGVSNKSSDPDQPSWIVEIRLLADIAFVTSPSDFTTVNFDKIQPPIFKAPDGGTVPQYYYQEYNLQQVNINVERAELGNWSISNPSTYELAGEVVIEKPQSSI